MKRYRVGLTGGLASGKSSVAARFALAGMEVVDADRLVSDLYLAGAPGALAVRELFGETYLDANGAVDKPKLADLVFSDEASKARLEGAVHPLVRARFRELAERPGGPIVLEATRLVEAGYAPDFDRIVSVEAPAAVRLERAIARGMPRPQAEARLASQGDGTLRREAAHRILTNSGTRAELESQVEALVEEIRRADRS